MAAISAFVISLVVAMSLLPLLVHYAGSLRLLDAPDPRKVHRVPVPRVGGIAIAVGVIAAVSLFGSGLAQSEGAFLGAALVIFFSGLLDDRFDLDYRLKFGGQIVACLLFVLAGNAQVSVLTLPQPTTLPNGIGFALTMFYMVGVTNAVNLSDGLDGLAGGMAFLGLCGLAWLSYISGQAAPFYLSLAFAGGVMGFLRFNTHPAVVFMGDAGSQLLGFAIGGLSLLATRSSATGIAATLPILLIGVPLLDTLQVMIRRIAARQSPFRADRTHVHHRLLALGLAHHEAVMLIYFLQAGLLVTAYLERFETDLVVLGTFAGFATTSLLLLRVLESRHTARRPLPARDAQLHARAEWWRAARANGSLVRVALAISGLAIAAYVILTICLAGPAPGDMSVAMGVLCAAIFFRAVTKCAAPLGWVDKGLLYAIVAALVLREVGLQGGVRSGGPGSIGWALILIVALSTVIALRVSPRREFVITPLDMIIVFMSLVVPNLPDLDLLPGFIPVAVAQLVVLFYALEVFLTSASVSNFLIRVAGFLTILALGLRTAWLWALVG